MRRCADHDAFGTPLTRSRTSVHHTLGSGSLPPGGLLTTTGRAAAPNAAHASGGASVPGSDPHNGSAPRQDEGGGRWYRAVPPT